ncbi:MAG: CopG family transcriptional regulator [Chroococcidiopsidaceae cyanobacterium CP_BM_ER_R8_30]|nr:CopG family transcriptional regulator [Chroococcidiopsidaceae cyanobacterium CP_BM_ER_R8_30]
MNRVKQYRVRLTEEEDELLKQKARDLGLSAADIIRLGIKYYFEKPGFGMFIQERSFPELKENSEFLRNWEKTFEQSIIQEFGVKWQNKLKLAYLQTLEKYKGIVYYRDGKFMSSIIVTEENRNTLLEEETQTETLSEQEVKEGICQSLTKYLGGEWKGDEGIVHTFLAGLKVDLGT